jgi:hypothetical protein
MLDPLLSVLLELILLVFELVDGSLLLEKVDESRMELELLLLLSQNFILLGHGGFNSSIQRIIVMIATIFTLNSSASCIFDESRRSLLISFDFNASLAL